MAANVSGNIPRTDPRLSCIEAVTGRNRSRRNVGRSKLKAAAIKRWGGKSLPQGQDVLRLSCLAKEAKAIRAYAKRNAILPAVATAEAIRAFLGGQDDREVED